jgi:hypothetical protein
MNAAALPAFDTDWLPAATRLLSPARMLRHEPFDFIVVPDLLPAASAPALLPDYPHFNEAGFFPYTPQQCGPRFNALVAALTAPAFADALGAQVNIERLSQYPTLVTLCGRMNKRHGTIHTDSRSKVATALLYLNTEWPDTSDGCLRFLANARDIDAMVVPEVRPLFGTLAMFKRADNSFHGHLPCEGERKVLQIAWVVSEEAKARKTRRGRFSRLMKQLFGGLDRKLGAGRDRNAGHLD